MLLGELDRNFNLDSEVVNSCDWLLHLFSNNANASAFRGQLELAKVLRGVERCTRSERCQKKLRRGHPFIKAAILRRLIARDRMLTRFDFELNRSEMLDCHFHS